MGKIQSRDFVQRCSEISKLPLFEPELDIPLYYDLSEITDDMGVRTPRILEVLSELKSSGHSASRTRLNPKAVRTDAPLPELQEILKQLAR
ncbi:MAG: hypothetical protein ACREBS_09735 [Nitrososphaerales archaeon]